MMRKGFESTDLRFRFVTVHVPRPLTGYINYLHVKSLRIFGAFWESLSKVFRRSTEFTQLMGI